MVGSLRGVAARGHGPSRARAGGSAGIYSSVGAYVGQSPEPEANSMFITSEDPVESEGFLGTRTEGTVGTGVTAGTGAIMGKTVGKTVGKNVGGSMGEYDGIPVVGEKVGDAAGTKRTSSTNAPPASLMSSRPPGLYAYDHVTLCGPGPRKISLVVQPSDGSRITSNISPSTIIPTASAGALTRDRRENARVPGPRDPSVERVALASRNSRSSLLRMGVAME